MNSTKMRRTTMLRCFGIGFRRTTALGQPLIMEESAAEAIDKQHADAIVFGRLFIANPDLAWRGSESTTTSR